MKTILTQKDYLQLVGLLTLARKYNALLYDLADVARELTGEEEEHGHTFDMVWTLDSDADELLRKLKIRVESSVRRRLDLEATSPVLPDPDEEGEETEVAGRNVAALPDRRPLLNNVPPLSQQAARAVLVGREDIQGALVQAIAELKEMKITTAVRKQSQRYLEDAAAYLQTPKGRR